MVGWNLLWAASWFCWAMDHMTTALATLRRETLERRSSLIEYDGAVQICCG